MHWREPQFRLRVQNFTKISRRCSTKRAKSQKYPLRSTIWDQNGKKGRRCCTPDASRSCRLLWRPWMYFRQRNQRAWMSWRRGEYASLHPNQTSSKKLRAKGPPIIPKQKYSSCESVSGRWMGPDVNKLWDILSSLCEKSAPSIIGRSTGHVNTEPAAFYPARSRSGAWRKVHLRKC